VALGEGHRTRLEPTIEDLRDSLEHTSAFLGGDLNVVDELSVDVGQRTAARETLKLFNGADANDFFAIVGNPDGDRVAPVSVPGEAPVAGVFQPVVEPLFLDESWNPLGGLVQFTESLLDICDLDEPTVEATVNERGLRSPAERITMLDGASGEKFAHSLDVLDDSLVGVLDVDTVVSLNDWKEFSILVDGHWSLAGLDDASSDTRSVIVLSEAGSTMDDTSTAVLGDPGGGKNCEAAIDAALLEESIEGLVALANENLTFELFNDSVSLDFALLQNVVETVFHANVDLLSGLVPPSDVVKCGIDSEGQV